MEIELSGVQFWSEIIIESDFKTTQFNHIHLTLQLQNSMIQIQNF